jgi:hypothetical protein
MDHVVARLRTLPCQLTTVGFAIGIFVAVGSLTWPLGRDQANFAWVGRVILDGGVPYRDAWDVKGPLSYYLYALDLAIFGSNAVSIRVLDLISVLLCCWLLRRLILRLNGEDTFGANCATILFALLYYAGGFWCTVQPDEWGGMLILPVVMLLLDSPWTPRWIMLAAGGLVALAALFKPTFLLFLVLPVLCPAGDPTRWIDRLRLVGYYLLAFNLVIGASMLALSQLSGGLGDFSDLLRFLYFSYHPPRSLSSEWVALSFALWYGGLLIPLLLAPIGVVLMRRAGQGRSVTVIASWFALTVLLVVIQGRYWPYHWIPADIAIAALSGVVFTSAGRRLVVRGPGLLGSRALALLICMAALTLAGKPALLASYEWPSYVFGLETRYQYLTDVTTPWDYWAYERLSAYIVSHSDPNDRVLMWGWDAFVNVLSARKSPTRFGYSLPLVTAGPLHSRYRALFLAEIEHSPPRYIIVDAQEPWDLMDRTGLQLLEDFPEFRQFVSNRYTLVSKVNAFQLFTRLP